MTELRAAAEALLQTAQLHQQNFLTTSLESQAPHTELQNWIQHQVESDQRFEIMLSKFRQLKIESDIRFNALQAEIRRLVDRLLNQQNGNT